MINLCLNQRILGAFHLKCTEMHWTWNASEMGTFHLEMHEKPLPGMIIVSPQTVTIYTLIDVQNWASDFQFSVKFNR